MSMFFLCMICEWISRCCFASHRSRLHLLVDILLALLRGASMASEPSALFAVEFQSRRVMPVMILFEDWSKVRRLRPRGVHDAGYLHEHACLDGDRPSSNTLSQRTIHTQVENQAHNALLTKQMGSLSLINMLLHLCHLHADASHLHSTVQLFGNNKRTNASI